MRSKRYALRFQIVGIERSWTVSQSIDPIVTLSIIDMMILRNWKLAKAMQIHRKKSFLKLNNYNSEAVLYRVKI